MHFRRLACLLLGGWLTGLILVAMVAAQNFHTVDRLLLDPQPAAALELKTMGHEFSRMLLRWEAGEQNRWMFAAWETAQLAIGMVLFFVLLFGSTESKFSLALALLMVVLVLVERLLLTPMMTALGRVIDFVPVNTHSVDRIKFAVLHDFYIGLEAGKFLLGLTLGGKLLIRSRRKSADALGNIDVVDKAYHRHVNR
jgi:hypothetical protein